MNIQKAKIIIYLFGFLVILIGLPGVLQLRSVSAQEPNISMVPGTVPMGIPIEKAVLQALVDGSSILPDVHHYAVTGLREDEAWLFVSVVGLANLNSDLRWNLPDNGAWVGLVLLYRNDEGQYVGAVEGTVEFSNLLASIPESILSYQVKRSLDPRLRPDVSIASTANRFPWATGTGMQYGSLGVHDNGFNGVVPGWKAVDFLSDGDTNAGHAPNSLLAAKSGSISYVCNDGTTVAIRIADLFYTHLLNNSNLYVGSSFNEGDPLGQMKSGDFSNSCGYASQGAGWFHVHWGFEDTGSFQAQDWSLSISDGQWRRSGETQGIGYWFEAGNGSGGSQVKLFSQANFGGSVVWQGSSDSNGPSADSYSLQVPSGWSVKAYDQDNYTGTEQCWNTSVNNLQDYGWHLRIRSIRVFQSDVCGGGSAQVKLFDQSNYGGNVVWQGSSDSNGPSANSYSLQIPSGWSVWVYDQDNYTGNRRCWNTSVSNLQDHGWQLRIQSIRVSQSDMCGGSGDPQVKLFELANFGGSVVWQGSSDSNGPSANSYSLQIPSGWSVKVYDQDNYGGAERCWDTSVNNLQDHGWQMRIQSIRVFRTPCDDGGGSLVKLYSQANYGGGVVWQGSSDSNDPNADSYSMEVPSGWSAWVYDQDNYTGNSRCWNTSVSNLQDHSWHLRIRSIRVRQYNDCPGGGGTVQLFELANYGGNIVWQGSSDSNDPNANSYSMKVPSGWSVVVYDQDNYTGNNRCWNTSVTNLQDHSWHLRIRSIRVYQSNVCPPPGPGDFDKNSPADGATGQATSLSLSWGPSTGAASYEYCYYEMGNSSYCNPDSNWINVGSVTSAGLSGLSSGTTYYWQVRARNVSGTTNGNRSVWWSFTTQVPAPSAPTNVQASDGTYTDKVQVTWSTSSGATSYEVWRNTSNNSGSAAQLASSVSGTSYDDTTAVVGTTYYYWVKAKNAGGTSGFSSSDSGYRNGTPPSAPTNVQASDGTYTDKVQVTWSASSGATSYEVWRNTSNNSGSATQLASSVSGTGYDDTSAAVGTTYYYWIKAKNAYGASGFSSSDSGYRNGTPPLPPTNVQASDGTYTDRVQVTWSVSSGATSYEVWRNTNNVSGSATQLASSVSGTSYDDTTAAVGTTYYYWVKAKNAYGTSGFSSSDSGYRNGTPPLPPTNVQASDGTYTDRVRVTWSVSSGATSYEVWRNTSNNSGSATQLASSVSGTSYDDTSAVVSTTYYYWAKAKNTYGTSGFSGSDSGYRNGTAPTPPTNVQASDGTFTDKVQVTWSASSGATSYEVWRNTSNNSGSATQLASSVSGTSYDDTTAAAGTTYYYWVKARNAYGVSEFSGSDSGYRNTETTDQVKLYRLANYEGGVVWQGSADSNDPNADSYSVHVPSGWSVKVYDQDNYSGVERCWDTSVNNLQDHGWHLRIRSIRVYQSDTCAGGGSQVKLYSQPNFVSVIWQGSSDSNDPNADSYSMEVPSGWSVKVYDQDNYIGTERCWNTLVSNLQDYNWHLRIRSIRIYTYDACTPPPPSAPTNVQASDGTYTDKVQVTWSASSGATSYEVWRNTSNVSGSATQLASSVSGTSYDDTTAVAGTTYYYWVKAKNSYGTSGFSSSDAGSRRASSFANGDFEKGADGAWIEMSAPDGGQGSLIRNTGFSITPHSGNWLAWLGKDTNNKTDDLSQAITLPPNGPIYLEYWYQIRSAESGCQYDSATVLINSTQVRTYNLCASNNTTTWVSERIDLSSYAGKTVTLHFHTQTDVSVASSFFVDDVALKTNVDSGDNHVYLPVIVRD